MQTAKRVIPVRDLASDADSRVTRPMKPDPRLLAIARGEIDPEALRPTLEMPAVLSPFFASTLPTHDPEPEDPFGGLILVEDDGDGDGAPLDAEHVGMDSDATMLFDEDMLVDEEPSPFSSRNFP